MNQELKAKSLEWQEQFDTLQDVFAGTKEVLRETEDEERSQLLAELEDKETVLTTHALIQICGYTTRRSVTAGFLCVGFWSRLMVFCWDLQQCGRGIVFDVLIGTARECHLWMVGNPRTGTASLRSGRVDACD